MILLKGLRISQYFLLRAAKCSQISSTAQERYREALESQELMLFFPTSVSISMQEQFQAIPVIVFWCLCLTVQQCYSFLPRSYQIQVLCSHRSMQKKLPSLTSQVQAIRTKGSPTEATNQARELWLLVLSDWPLRLSIPWTECCQVSGVWLCN